MTTARYAENTAATFNAQLARLEALALVTVNAMELVASGTLTSAVNEISMDLGSTTWAVLMLRANLKADSAGSVSLCANHDYVTDTRYEITSVTGDATGSFAGINSFGDMTAGYAPSATEGYSEITIWPHSLGFTALAKISALIPVQGLLTQRVGGFYTGGAMATSLQIRAGAGIKFSVGSVYRLEGVRA
jgi:hypothetical protein